MRVQKCLPLCESHLGPAPDPDIQGAPPCGRLDRLPPDAADNATSTLRGKLSKKLVDLDDLMHLAARMGDVIELIVHRSLDAVPALA